MRRSLISMTTVNRLVTISNRTKREKSNTTLINSHKGNEKEKPPQYHLDSVEFNLDTRISRIEFTQVQEYRTIQRYITQNYVKYPIYSDWKLKTKQIKKTVKLTNLTLESLNTHKDFLIRSFAEEIIVKLNNEELFPSWFLRLNLTREFDENLQVLDTEYANYKNNQQSKIKFENDTIATQTNELEKLHKSLRQLEKKLTKNENRLKKISCKKNSLLKGLLTFGIYAYLISQRRKNKLCQKSNKLTLKIEEVNLLIKGKDNIIATSKQKIHNYDNQIKEKEKEIKVKKDCETASYNEKISFIHPLENIVEVDTDFFPLKLFSGFEYERILGCYIIHNKEKDKYYVGQSKDVMKRLKQHFKGTVPKNQIFAEDYYTSQFDNKEDLFEIKIIKCETKDELDRVEKQLIYEYDSWNIGYNGTSGNI